jgi:hypothetical protein
MSFSQKDYYHAQLPNSKATLITAGATNKISIRSIHLCNTNTFNETPTIHYNNGTNDLIIFKPVVKPNETKQIEFACGSLVLSPSHTISGSTNTASKVTCTIMGEEKIGLN